MGATHLRAAVPDGSGAPRTKDRGRDDRTLLYGAKIVRAIAYGALSGFLVLYLNVDLGFSVLSTLVITGLSLAGAAAWSFFAVPPLERRIGRRRSLLLFATLFAVSGALLFLVASPIGVIVAVMLGGVAAQTADNGPLASLEQAVLPSTLARAQRTQGFAWYNLLASFASAGGALLLVVPGALAPQRLAGLPSAPHPWLVFLYALLGVANVVAYLGLSNGVDAGRDGEDVGQPLSARTRSYRNWLGALFGVDAFAGGLVINPFVAEFFFLAWHASQATIGAILFVAGTASALSFLAASALARRFGLLPTMVFTHLPSNVLLALVPFMPSFGLALGVYIARTSISQMDVPTRQAYTMNLVARRERARVASSLAGARGAAASFAPFPSAALFGAGLLALPFALAGGLKVVYDLAIWQRFRRVPVDDGRPRPAAEATLAAPSAPSPPASGPSGPPGSR